MPTAKVEYPQLFSHMLPTCKATCKPVELKTHKFAAADQEPIRIERKRLLQEGRIEKSNSPWHAQPLIDDHGNDKKRMCIDFSQTVNLYTMLDAYPLPTIKSIVNEVAKWKYIATLNLNQPITKYKSILKTSTLLLSNPVMSCINGNINHLDSLMPCQRFNEQLSSLLLSMT